MKSIFGLFDNLTGFDLKESKEKRKGESLNFDDLAMESEIERRKLELESQRAKQQTQSYELEK